jgi:hypothetical protein
MEPDREIEEFKRQCVVCLEDVYREIEGLADNVRILSDEHLEALHIRKLEPLDVEEQRVDFGPRFFYPRFTLEQAQQITVDFVADHRAIDPAHEHTIWPKRCRRGSYVSLLEDPEGRYDPEEPHPLCHAFTGADFRLQWFLHVIGLGFRYESWETRPAVWDGSEWCMK